MGLDYYEITTPAVEYPVTLSEVKEACKISHSLEDDLITSLIQAATDKLEMYTNRVFVERSYTGYFEILDCSKLEKWYFLRVRRAPLQSVSSFEVTEDDSQTVISSDDYHIKFTTGYSRIVFETGVLYLPDRIPYPWQVDFVAGYGGADDVPDMIKMMIKQYVCYLYSNRGDCVDAKEMPSMVKAMADEWRIVQSFG